MIPLGECGGVIAERTGRMGFRRAEVVVEGFRECAGSVKSG
jgi:hypothetical protein